MSGSVTLDALDRVAMATLLRQMVENDPLAQIALAPASGESLEASLSMLLMAASSDARTVFSSALGDVVQSYLDSYLGYAEEQDSERVLSALDLMEVGMDAGVQVDGARFIGMLSALVQDDALEVVEAAARLLSYLRSPDALATLEELYARRPSSPTIASYLIDARSRVDPLTALELRFDQIEREDFTEATELSLAIQAAIWAMFEDDAPRASTKLQVLTTRQWPSTLISLVLSVLQERPLLDLPSARQVARGLYRAGILLEGGHHQPTGIAKRVLERGTVINCMDGYSLSALTERGLFKSYNELWMRRLAEEVCAILAEIYPGYPPLKPSFIPWPRNQKWIDMFDRVRLERGLDRDNPAPTTDICFEMFYIDDLRSGLFSVVQFAQLQTFSVVHRLDNQLVVDALKAVDLEAPPNRDLESFLAATKKGTSVGEIEIFCLNSNVATDWVRDRFNRTDWDPDRLHSTDDVDDLLHKLREKPQVTVVICDNVVASDLVTRANTSRITATQMRYPKPVPVGLVVDAADPDWTGILNMALDRIAADPDPDLRASLLKHVNDLQLLPARLTGSLAKAFGGSGRNTADREVMPGGVNGRS